MDRMSAVTTMSRLWIAVAVLALVVAPRAVQARADVTVFAAASLQGALNENVRRFEAGGGKRVALSYAASSALARQIERGAPADIFISADPDWMDYLAGKRLIRPDTRVSLLTNSLALIAPAHSRVALEIAPGFGLAAALGPRRLALADIDAVPAGKYARAALESLGVWKDVAPRIIRTVNVRAALAFVARGEAPLGIVYRTDALAEPKVRIVAEFPPRLHPAIVYPAALVASSRAPAAASLLNYLGSPPARAVWRRHGFGAGEP